jgi:hypothetical protein
MAPTHAPICIVTKKMDAGCHNPDHQKTPQEVAAINVCMHTNVLLYCSNMAFLVAVFCAALVDLAEPFLVLSLGPIA